MTVTVDATGARKLEIAQRWSVELFDDPAEVEQFVAISLQEHERLLRAKIAEYHAAKGIDRS